ncbi:hypothetical protein NNO_0936 [Hydrogenimonas sp.]|nr:hypothetical protein NNO_0936 [Hydrogenimonas sp.]
MFKRSVPLLVLAAVSTAFCATDAEELMQKRCAVCHMTSNPTAEKVKHMVAPPMWGVVRHLKREIGSKDEFVAFVSDYIMNPSEGKIRFNREAFERFGLMPSMKGSISEKEAKEIAEYLYSIY